jgi:hypothetical protein
VSSQIVRIVTEDSPPREVLAVTDPDPIRAVATRLIAVLDDPAPGALDVAFAVVQVRPASPARTCTAGNSTRTACDCLS